MPPVSRTVKTFIFICVGVFLVQSMLGSGFDRIFGFVPGGFLQGKVWQILTYLFLHGGVFHLLLNMLVLAMLGSELERVWGPKFFSVYLAGCGIGAVLLYGVGVFFFMPDLMNIPVVGASGSIYGLLLAYAIIFPYREMLFMFLFPIKAKYFVMIIGAVELYTTMTRTGGNVANLVHLSGFLIGYLILLLEAKRRTRSRRREPLFFKRKKSHLKVVINND